MLKAKVRMESNAYAVPIAPGDLLADRRREKLERAQASLNSIDNPGGEA
jgi:hypothetical protein